MLCRDTSDISSPDHPHAGGTAAPNILRNFTERTVHTPSPHLDSNGLGRRWVDKLAQLDVEVSQDTADSNDAGRVRKAVSPRHRKPTPLQTARWRAVRKAKRKGLSIRGIARELGIHRDTVKKYMNAESHLCRGGARSRQYRSLIAWQFTGMTFSLST